MTTDGMPYGAGLTLEQRLARLEQRMPASPSLLKPGRHRFTLGHAALPGGTGDFIQCLAPLGGLILPYFVALGGSYAVSGMWTIGAMDLAMGGTGWRVRTFYDFIIGDQSAVHTYIIGANAAGIYAGTAFALVGGSEGTYDEGSDSSGLQQPRTLSPAVGGHRPYAHVGPWLPRAALVASGKLLFGAGFHRVTAPTSVGWFGRTGLEFEAA